MMQRHYVGQDYQPVRKSIRAFVIFPRRRNLQVKYDKILVVPDTRFSSFCFRENRLPELRSVR